MKKLFLILFLLSQVTGESDFQIFDIQKNLQAEHATIFININEIFNINNDISTFSQKAQDKNLTIFDDELSYLEGQKAKLLQTLPVELVKNKDTNYEEVGIFFNKEINNLEKMLKEEASQESDFNFLTLQYSLSALKATKAFYDILFQLKHFSVEGENKRQIDRFLKDSIKNMQTKIFSEPENEAKLSKQERELLESTVKKYELLLDSYEEILIYLSKNSYIFNESFTIKTLKLAALSNFINESLHLENSFFHSGKILVTIFVTLFLYVIRKIIYNLLYYLITRTILVKHYKEDLVEKSSILKMIEKPVAFSLILFNIDLWISLFYHPLPLPKILRNIFEILYIFNITWFIIALISIYGTTLIKTLTDVKDKKEVANLALKMLKILLAIISFIIMLNIFGFDPSALLASFGIGGLAIAFASKDIIANFFSSILLIFENSISQGDEVEIEEISGTVVEIGLRNTIVRDEENALIFIPNSKIVDTNIVNLSRRKVGRKITFLLVILKQRNKDELDELVDEIKKMLFTNEKIAHSRDSSKNSEELLDLTSSFVSADDLEGFKNSIFVYLTALDESLSAATQSFLGIQIKCFSKTINSKEYYKSRDEVFYNIMEICEKRKLEFIFVKNNTLT